MTNNIITVNNTAELLQYMTEEATSNSNLFRDDFPTDYLYEGRVIFLKVPEVVSISEEE